MPPFPGQFVISRTSRTTPLTARAGNHSSNALISNATSIGPNEQFTLDESGPPLGTTLRRSSNFFVSARGNIGAENDTATFQTEEMLPDNNAKFTLTGPASNGAWTIGSARRSFRHRGRRRWPGHACLPHQRHRGQELGTFYILKAGDLGSGLPYVIRPAGTGNVPGQVGAEYRHTF